MVTNGSVPDSSAVRTALWRALHVRIDPEPHFIDDEIGLALVAPDAGWEQRGDMHPEGTAPYRIGIVARTRFVEDLVINGGFAQYVLLGAGLDTFAQRHPEVRDQVTVFEIDQSETLAWKRGRLVDTHFEVAENLHFVPTDFGANNDWWADLRAAGFNSAQPAVVYSSGVSMYLTDAANRATLEVLSGLPEGSVIAMTFMVPIDTVSENERRGLQAAAQGAKASGTPWLSFYTRDAMHALATSAGFAQVTITSITEIVAALSVDAACIPSVSEGECLLVATV